MITGVININIQLSKYFNIYFSQYVKIVKILGYYYPSGPVG